MLRGMGCAESIYSHSLGCVTPARAINEWRSCTSLVFARYMQLPLGGSLKTHTITHISTLMQVLVLQLNAYTCAHINTRTSSSLVLGVSATASSSTASHLALCCACPVLRLPKAKFCLEKNQKERRRVKGEEGREQWDRQGGCGVPTVLSDDLGHLFGSR